MLHVFQQHNILTALAYMNAAHTLMLVLTFIYEKPPPDPKINHNFSNPNRSLTSIHALPLELSLHPEMIMIRYGWTRCGTMGQLDA